MKTPLTSVTVHNLKPGTVYVFQIRTSSSSQDYGSYSPSIEVETLGECKLFPVHKFIWIFLGYDVTNQLYVTGGSICPY